MRKAAYAIVLSITLVGAAVAQESNTAFPRPDSLKPAIDFWTRVYTEVDTKSGFIHDSQQLNVVYTIIDVPSNSRQRRRLIQRSTDHYREILNKLAGDRGNLSTEEARVLSLWPKDVSDAELRRATRRLRFQLGQADRFLAGLVRSGRWKAYIHKVLDDNDMPRELAALPHVESSFDPTAYSKVGAAGMWQFTRSTGVRYMQIDHIVDERRDPFLSTEAAARLLQDNYAVIQSWPLAITAYNHGLAGMRRAVRRQKTDDIGVIVESYTSRTFGFASRNFYVAFLAAVDVDANAERYFGPFDPDPPADFVLATTTDYMDAATVARAVNVPVNELRRANPALMDTVWAGDKFVPKGFELRLPSRNASDPVALLAAVATGDRYAAQRPDEYHRVRRGETLSQIAERYRVSLAALVRTNNLRSRNFIRTGQLITLPIGASASRSSLAQVSREPLPSDGEYVVRRGDSVDLIARRFGVDETTLLSANEIANRNRIYEGQVLRVPEFTNAAAETQTGRPIVVTASDPVIETVAESEIAQVAAAAPPPRPIIGQPAVFTLIAEQRGLPAGRVEEAVLDDNVLASEQAQLAADPSDYSVAANSTIEVQANETLGHYADWLEIRTQRLRDINGMPFRQAVVLGQRIELDFSTVEAASFEQRRLAYQEDLQESFFSTYQIADIEDHVIRTGDSLFLLALRTYRIPVWLLRQYNPDLDLDRVNPGTVVKFPRLRPIAG